MLAAVLLLVTVVVALGVLVTVLLLVRVVLATVLLLVVVGVLTAALLLVLVVLAVLVVVMLGAFPVVLPLVTAQAVAMGVLSLLVIVVGVALGVLATLLVTVALMGVLPVELLELEVPVLIPSALHPEAAMPDHEDRAMLVLIVSRAEHAGRCGAVHGACLSQKNGLGQNGYGCTHTHTPSGRSVLKGSIRPRHRKCG